MPRNLDMDVLRTFVLGMDGGSFVQAAQRVGRSQAAVSLQLRKLEEQTGHTLFRRQGRGLALTPAGETLLSYARRILALNDDALAALDGAAVAGTVRLGLVQDFAERRLPAVLGRFARTHPAVRIEVAIDRGPALVRGLESGTLDLALLWGEAAALPHAQPLGRPPVAWLAADGWVPPDGPLPLLVIEQPCAFRAAAVAALDRAGIPWRVAVTSPSLSGLWAAAQAGLGVTPRVTDGAPAGVAPVAAGLPPLPPMPLALAAATDGDTPAAARLRVLLCEAVTGEDSVYGAMHGTPSSARSPRGDGN